MSEDSVEAAVIAQKELVFMSLEKREEIIQAIRDIVLENSELLGKMEFEETGMERLENKISHFGKWWGK